MSAFSMRYGARVSKALIWSENVAFLLLACVRIFLASRPIGPLSPRMSLLVSLSFDPFFLPAPGCFPPLPLRLSTLRLLIKFELRGGLWVLATPEDSRLWPSQPVKPPKRIKPRHSACGRGFGVILSQQEISFTFGEGIKLPRGIRRTKIESVSRGEELFSPAWWMHRLTPRPEKYEEDYHKVRQEYNPAEYYCNPVIVHGLSTWDAFTFSIISACPASACSHVEYRLCS